MRSETEDNIPIRDGEIDLEWFFQLTPSEDEEINGPVKINVVSTLGDDSPEKIAAEVDLEKFLELSESDLEDIYGPAQKRKRISQTPSASQESVAPKRSRTHPNPQDAGSLKFRRTSKSESTSLKPGTIKKVEGLMKEDLDDWGSIKGVERSERSEEQTRGHRLKRGLVVQETSTEPSTKGRLMQFQ